MRTTRQKKQLSKKDLLKPGTVVWCVDDKYRHLQGTVVKVEEDFAICSMVNKHILASKSPFEIKLSVNRLHIIH